MKETPREGVSHSHQPSCFPSVALGWSGASDLIFPAASETKETPCVTMTCKAIALRVAGAPVGAQKRPWEEFHWGQKAVCTFQTGLPS